MVEYIISLKLLFLTDVVGIVLGYLLSCFINSLLFEEQTQATANGSQIVIDITLWGMITAFIISVIDLACAATDYYLSSNPAFNYSYFTLMGGENIINRFIIAFLLGMSSTLLRVGELIFAMYKKD